MIFWSVFVQNIIIKVWNILDCSSRMYSRTYSLDRNMQQMLNYNSLHSSMTKHRKWLSLQPVGQNWYGNSLPIYNTNHNVKPCLGHPVLVLKLTCRWMSNFTLYYVIILCIRNAVLILRLTWMSFYFRYMTTGFALTGKLSALLLACGLETISPLVYLRHNSYIVSFHFCCLHIHWTLLTLCSCLITRLINYKTQIMWESPYCIC